MYKGCRAKLKMERMILSEGFFNETVYSCKVITYNPQEECIYLLIGKTELPVFSLDGVYECHIISENERIVCRGMIKERYVNKLGKVIVLRVQNGFYKNLIN